MKENKAKQHKNWGKGKENNEDDLGQPENTYEPTYKVATFPTYHSPPKPSTSPTPPLHHLPADLVPPPQHLQPYPSRSHSSPHLHLQRTNLQVPFCPMQASRFLCRGENLQETNLGLLLHTPVYIKEWASLSEGGEGVVVCRREREDAWCGVEWNGMLKEGEAWQYVLRM